MRQRYVWCGGAIAIFTALAVGTAPAQDLGVDDDLLVEDPVLEKADTGLAAEEPVELLPAEEPLPVEAVPPAGDDLVLEPVPDEAEGDLVGVEDLLPPGPGENGIVVEDVPEETPAAGLDALIEGALEDTTPEMAPVPGETVEAGMAPAPGMVGAGGELVDVIREAEVLRRLAFERHALDTLDRADEALSSRDYEDAKRLFKEALDVLRDAGERPQNETLRRRARAGIAESLYREASLLMRLRDLDAAEERAKASALYGSIKAPKLVAQILKEKEEALKPPPDPPPPPARWKQADFKAQRKKIQALLREGYHHYIANEYAEAETKIRGVLYMDPHNTEAIRVLQKIQNARYDASSVELEATRKGMIATVRETWNPRDYGVSAEALPNEGPTTANVTEYDKQRRKILGKMESIIIPEIDFRQANIHDVIDFLQEASVEYDKPKDENERRGVNLILHLGKGGGGAGPAPATDLGIFEPAEGMDMAAGGAQQVTFSARYISLLEALNIVTEIAGLKYYVKGSVVMIVPVDAAVSEIVHRTYDVMPSFMETIKIWQPDTSGGDAGGSDFITMGGGGLGAETEDLKQFFDSLGINWPDNSSIRYIPQVGKLVVANTEENLLKFEDVLAKLNVVPTQVEIEARFVEVAQEDLNSLGFEWSLTDDWEIAERASTPNVPYALKERVVMPANSAAGGYTRGLRFMDDAAGTDAAVADDVLSLVSVLTNPELSMVLHALAQKGNTDLLSAPKITTQRGTEATIKVVTEYIYPTDFDVEPITGTDAFGNNSIVGGVVEPSGFETREVGVILSVLPEVTAEGLINLTMTPEVVSDPIWYEYGSVYVAPDGSEQRLNMQQPFFQTRTLSTTIVIYNGATVVMGGMITESRSEVDDKVPLLGDIPIVGRLFQSRHETSIKRNLLVFVTAKLVDPAGRAVISEGVWSPESTEAKAPTLE